MRFAAACAALLSIPLAAYAAVIPHKRATVCNGHAELCNRSYGNTTFAGSHDSYAFSENPFARTGKRPGVDITTQLNSGIRMLQAQSHMNNGQLHFCHTSCTLFDGGTVEAYLATVKSWLDANPNDVVTFLFTNPEGVSLPDVWAPAFEQSGIAPLAYVPPHVPMARGEWPTLGALIDSGKRVVVFMDAGADGADGNVNYILPEFEMIWEPPFDSTDNTFPCSVDRSAGPLSTADHMYLLNHFLDVNILDTGILVSDPAAASTTNGVTSVLANAAGCRPLSGGGFNPSFVLMDYVNLGNGVAAADQMNGF
ncbi:PLC-like phosphodiesterase [Epithele typhae]|uniref:PLC-like phosphodiesterase n=1 Tax=Epithele typhae TaxID=378194 RepID=UPI002008E0A9|nr:PLC-like phosphodiesterase [Epithele typhae]KAH9946394.1 PLC-like phosphodiesterase [Epithele typhae]